MKTTRTPLPWYERGFIVASSCILAAFVIHLAVRLILSL
jgi:hypothetical protein